MKRRIRRRRSPGFAFWSLVVALGLPTLIWFGWCKIAGNEMEGAAVRQVAIRADEMIIRGPMDKVLQSLVEDALPVPHAEITTVRLSSLGGDESVAQRIKTLLENLGIRHIVVPAGFPCASACLVVALTAGARFEPADTATLLFHREWIADGPQRCFACRPFNWVRNARSDEHFGAESHRFMKIWADRLAPGLGGALAACRPNPFDTLAGISIDGLTFKRFSAGIFDAILCPSANRERIADRRVAKINPRRRRRKPSGPLPWLDRPNGAIGAHRARIQPALAICPLCHDRLIRQPRANDQS